MTTKEMQSFREALANANRVIALCGAGLSAASGLGVRPTNLLPSLTCHSRRSAVQVAGGETTKQPVSQPPKHSPVTPPSSGNSTHIADIKRCLRNRMQRI